MSEPAAPPAPATAPAPTTLGFLSIVTDTSGVFGGYLLTNAWGRPLEFRLSSAVQPTRVQQILYGPTLTEYLHADLIGQTLVEKAASLPGLIVTDSVPALALWGKLGIPAVALGSVDGDVPGDLLPVAHPRATTPLLMPAAQAGNRAALESRLNAVDSAVLLAEPFARIREAMAEARKLGVASRAA